MVLLISAAYCVTGGASSLRRPRDAVQVTGVPERPAHLVALRNVVEQCALLRLVAVNFQAEHAKTRIIQAAANHFKSSELLGNKENVFPLASAAAIRFVMVCDLPVPGGPSMTRFWPRKRMYQRAVLRAVGVPDEVRDDPSSARAHQSRIPRPASCSDSLSPRTIRAPAACLAMLWPAGHVFGSRSRYMRSLPKLRSASVICRRMDQRFLSSRISSNFRNSSRAYRRLQGREFRARSPGASSPPAKDLSPCLRRSTRGPPRRPSPSLRFAQWSPATTTGGQDAAAWSRRTHTIPGTRTRGTACSCRIPRSPSWRRSRFCGSRCRAARGSAGPAAIARVFLGTCIEIEGCVPAELVGIVFRGGRSALDTPAPGRAEKRASPCRAVARIRRPSEHRRRAGTRRWNA